MIQKVCWCWFTAIPLVVRLLCSLMAFQRLYYICLRNETTRSLIPLSLSRSLVLSLFHPVCYSPALPSVLSFSLLRLLSHIFSLSHSLPLSLSLYLLIFLIPSLLPSQACPQYLTPLLSPSVSCSLCGFSPYPMEDSLLLFIAPFPLRLFFFSFSPPLSLSLFLSSLSLLLFSRSTGCSRASISPPS